MVAVIDTKGRWGFADLFTGHRGGVKSPSVCSIPGCGKRHYGRGWCGAHYRRWQTHGNSLMVAPPVAVASMTGARWRAATDLTIPTGYAARICADSACMATHVWGTRVEYGKHPTCTIDGCQEPYKGRGMCSTHYGRWRHHGDLLSEVRPYSRAPAGGLCTGRGLRQDSLRAGIVQDPLWARAS